MLTEFDIFQNRLVGAQVLWEFVKSYHSHNVDSKYPHIIFLMPVLPICFNMEIVRLVRRRSFSVGSLVRVLEERSDIFSGVQERTEEMAELTFQSIYIASVSGLISIDDPFGYVGLIENGYPTILKDIASNKNCGHIFDSAKRIGAWFGQLNEAEIFSYFNLTF